MARHVPRGDDVLFGAEADVGGEQCIRLGGSPPGVDCRELRLLLISGVCDRVSVTVVVFVFLFQDVILAKWLRVCWSH